MVWVPFLGCEQGELRKQVVGIAPNINKVLPQ